MSPVNICPDCGVPLPAKAPEGLCPRCLLARSLASDTCPPEGDVEEAEEAEESGAPTTPFTGVPLRRIGDYDLLGEIARGGMGVVYRARQRSLNRLVAVKLISAGALATPELVKRFRAEAEAAAGLAHPNIVPIFEIGEQWGQHFFSMELVEGPSLREVLDSPGLWSSPGGGVVSRLDFFRRPRRGAELVATLADAVHYAHQRGVLHRDVKPGNILLAPDGQPRLTDFGLARLLRNDSTLTRTDVLLGTPAYMAPEQARGDARGVTTSVDVYGLGAVLYEVLTGRPPFGGGTLLETIRQVLDQEPRRPSLWHPGVDRDLETICLRCLEKDPNRRYGSCEAVGDDLRRWLRHEPTHARRATRLERIGKWVRRRPAQAALGLASVLFLLVLAVGGSAYSLYLSAARDELENQLYVAETAMAFAAWDRGSVALPRRLLDGQIPAEGRHDRRGFEWRYLDRLCRPQASFSFPKESSPIFALACSPDGRRVACGHKDGRIRLLDLATRQETGTLPSEGWIFSAAFTADGRRLISSSPRRGFDVWDVERGTRVTNLIGHAPEKEALGVACSPDGRFIATTAAEGGLYERAFPGDVFLWDAATGAFLFALEGHEANAWRPAFSPDGRLLATPHSDGTITLWDLASRRARRIFRRHGDIVACVQFSPDGVWLASASMDKTVRLWRVQGDEHIPLGVHQRPVDCVAFSRDGKWLVSGSRDHTLQLWDLSDRRVRPRVLRGHTGRIWAVDFTPDSRRLVTGSLDATVKLWDLPGLRAPSDPADNATSLGTAFSPDGRRSARTEGERVVIRDVDTEAVVATLPAIEAGFSPEGTLATVAGGRGFVLWDGHSFARREEVPSDAVLNGAVQFSPDGRWLALAREVGDFDGVTRPPRARTEEHREGTAGNKPGTWSREERLGPRRVARCPHARPGDAGWHAQAVQPAHPPRGGLARGTPDLGRRVGVRAAWAAARFGGGRRAADLAGLRPRRIDAGRGRARSGPGGCPGRGHRFPVTTGHRLLR
jgi:WD40 repeat protein